MSLTNKQIEELKADAEFFRRFFSKVVISAQKDACWLWDGAKNSSGYGHMILNRKHMLAHRLSYLYFKGSIDDGLVVMHSCDNKLCVNPNHLNTGTQGQNCKDAYKRGLREMGEGHPNAKLTNSQAIEIRRRKFNGERTVDLAEEYGVCNQTICYIASGQIWSEITSPPTTGGTQ